MTHLRKGEIESFLAGRSSQEDRDRLLKHLLTRCEWCLRLFKNLAVPLMEDEPWAHAEEVPENAYDAPLARAAAGASRFAIRWRMNPSGWQEPGLSSIGLEDSARDFHSGRRRRSMAGHCAKLF